MTPAEARAAWVKALRSGEYRQTRHALRIGDEMCCLGVACDVHSRMVDDPGHWFTDRDDGSYHYMGQDANLPTVVMAWLGLTNSEGRLVTGIPARLNPIRFAIGLQ